MTDRIIKHEINRDGTESITTDCNGIIETRVYGIAKPTNPVRTTVLPGYIITPTIAELQRYIDELQKMERDLYRRLSKTQASLVSKDLRQHVCTAVHAITAALGVANREFNHEVEKPGSTINKQL